VPTVYVTGHRNPDLDSIASAIGYAELKGRLDPGARYVPVRLGEVNAQTRWALDRGGVPEPELLAHIHLRARDVMRPECHCAGQDASSWRPATPTSSRSRTTPARWSA
jgi:manganese-dependent inorganic pyrophosphatase